MNEAQPETTRRQAAQTQKQENIYRNQSVHIPEGYLAVGRITAAHGIRGEVRIELHTDFPERFDTGAVLYMGDALQEIEIEQSRLHKSQMLVQLRGVRQRSEAEALRGHWIFIHEADAAELEPDTYWIHDIIGLEVISSAGVRLGTISDVLSTGANDVYIVKTEASVNQGKDLLLPALADVIRSVDLEQGLLLVDLPPGLMDESEIQNLP